MIVKEKYKLDICSDCIYYNEYGNLGHNLLDKCRNTLGYTCETCVAVQAGFTKLSEEHGDYVIGWNCIPYFSWMPCDICESNLGGDRYAVNLIEHEERN
jgi:hypothetical protein